ncbi:MAG TPA: biotin carboxylase N-terminal domain-containing protein [Steroidobacteraceae bacterium]|jgi:3-methylcrotonyl-CoA carboxylase alpha subunit
MVNSIDTLLVANRGEIACRIFRTARRLGIRTIAVYSEADAGAKHVREADAAVCIGPAPARESYLDIEKLLRAAQATRARAIHPGYGFLSENSGFAQACVDAGLIFVGPPAAAMAAMGSKSVAKTRMRKAGVPVLPGYEGARQELDHLESIARTLELPLMIKPAAGGGGKGMRVVTETSQICPALSGARRLAESAFADGALLLERYLAAPRHVEVQVFADTLGNAIHLGDRDCSLQRRHQKVVEEAPAPDLPADVRERMRAAALVVAREIGYVGAGTVEFLFDAGQFYFMEMNTRLQVEHTVTEAVTGLDLVEWQLRVASGEPLPLRQDEIQLHGHAIEARVCAEDPEREFLPSAGRLRDCEWPAAQSIRVDAGFESGDEVPASYDSLLGKVIATGNTREEAAARLAAALDRTYIAGVRTNERWLARVVRSEEFLAVRHSVAFLQTRAKQFQVPREPDPEVLTTAAIAAVAGPNPASGMPAADLAPAASPWDARDGFVPNLPSSAGVTLRLGDRSFPVIIDPRSHLHRRRADRLRVYDSHIHLWWDREHYEFLIDDPRKREYSASAASGGLSTPLPGVVVSIPVTVGQKVAAGEALMVVEAMKMEHTITAPHAGIVRAIHSAPGERVPEGKALLDLAPE